MEEVEKNKPDIFKKRRMEAINNIDELYEPCKVLTTFVKIKDMYSKSPDGTLTYDQVNEAVTLMHKLGDEAHAVYGRAVLTVLARSNAKIAYVKATETSQSYYRFTTVKNKPMTGISINNEGKLIIDKKIKGIIDMLRKGAIAADVDLTTALRDKNIVLCF